MKREEYKQMRKKGKRLRNTFIGLGSFLFVMAIGLLLLMFGGRFFVSEDAMTLDAATTVVADGEEIEEIYSTNRSPISLEEVPEFLQEAVVATEDSRFYEHSGIDPRGIARALYRDVLAWEKVEGASTITQQVAKNLFFSNDKSWLRKTKEVMVALYLERNYTKDEILELYLNSIYFGEGTYGVEKAAERYFSKPVPELNETESALLAGLPKAPSNYSPIADPEAAKDRRDTVLFRMEDEGYITKEEEEALSNRQVEYTEEAPVGATWSNAYVNVVVQEVVDRYGVSREALKTEGYEIEVNMNPEAQRIAYETMKDGNYASGSVEGVEAAFVLTDKEGKVTALTGGREYEHGEMNHALTKHQPASVMKPLAVYGPALMGDTYSPYSVLKDEKISYGGYIPKNLDGYEGQVTLYEALVKSKNAPAVWLLNEIGVKESKSYLEKLGLATEDDDLSIALGGMSEGYSPMEIAGGYQAVGNDGERVPLRTVSTITDRTGETVKPKEEIEAVRVFSEKTAFQLREMLETVVSSGTARNGSYSGALAGKTGTAQHPEVEGKNRDVWFAGFTPNYAMSMWMGYGDSGSDYYLEDSSSVPVSLTKQMLTNLKEVLDPGEEFTDPEGLTSLEEPVELPRNIQLEGSIDIGGWTLVRGKLDWNTDEKDEDVTYRIYRKKGEEKELITKTKETSHTIQSFGLFDSRTYYVVPFDPESGREGEPSNEVTLEW
ncbi:transglycosylase domain-containing protein [Salimicrobium album]|uniref:Penicillin-binding protein 2A n=1 Tax=Salimicrobium album TaxID=50717 RepID=A0A1H3BXG2_9BACI|nr:transglycosylase domain-containing protein [Salimicrobium album]SDX46553.1 penicillin-binding protein 2A [Salimicrobium album]